MVISDLIHKCGFSPNWFISIPCGTLCDFYGYRLIDRGPLTCPRQSQLMLALGLPFSLGQKQPRLHLNDNKSLNILCCKTGGGQNYQLGLVFILALENFFLTQKCFLMIHILWKSPLILQQKKWPPNLDLIRPNGFSGWFRMLDTSQGSTPHTRPGG